MNEIKKQIEDFKAYSKWLLEDENRVSKFLVDAGILDKNGKLTEQYRPEIRVKNKEDM